MHHQLIKYPIYNSMAVGTTSRVKHNLKEDKSGQGDLVRGHDEIGKVEASSSCSTVGGAEGDKQKLGSHHSHDSCKICGSLADKCSCKDCECQVCASKSGAATKIEPPIKSATSSTNVCGSACIAAAKRVASGKCPGCECPGGNCSCTKCGYRAYDSSGKRVTTPKCPACDCPSSNCPCTGCKCPVCKFE
ncbi:uncharacterized protein PHALS_09503 [Plasmopara halstedii]|uniref:Uncharacterized protein n=1 Tax=Plasmopara halstedii TaxID=4781 RepID=A0A0P1A639_PLAHL|nr:uncharacterized protein PHALS_09503 [Plasmopara halstedii]CEG35380.1 hypothetical protein PHALS_09503 [Plasmopara halstedii]|eukprot:XP_024571749.1 hypothetical protein PHALS_09503 [Plasmopara halstedii]